MTMRRGRTILAAAGLLALAGCGGSSGGDNGGDAPGPDGATFPSGATVTADTADTPYGLASGRYRLNWKGDCSKPTITLTPAEGGEPVYSANPNLKFVLVNQLDAGMYLINLEGEDCGDWEITLVSL